MAQIRFGPDVGATDVRPELPTFINFVIREPSFGMDGIYNLSNQLLSLSPDHAEGVFLRAFFLKANGNEPEFQDVWKRLPLSCADQDGAMSMLVSTLSSAGLFDLAADTALLWMEASPANPDPYEIGAEMAKVSKNNDLAERFIKAAQRNLPSPIHVPTTTYGDPSVEQARAELKASALLGEQSLVKRSNERVSFRQYFLDMDENTLNPKGGTLCVSSDVHASATPANDIPAIQLQSPFSQDKNHLQGIGFCNTVLGWYASAEIERRNITSELSNTPDGNIDLSGGELRVRIRPKNFQAHDFKLSLFCQTVLSESDDGRLDITPWALVGRQIDMNDLADHQWHTITFPFSAAPEDWCYAGNNPKTNTPKNRYVEGTLAQCLNMHGTSFALVFTGGTWPNIPEGAIDFHFIDLELIKP